MPVVALPHPPSAVVLHGLSSWQDEGPHVIPLVLAEASTFRSQIIPQMKAKRQGEAAALGQQCIEGEGPENTNQEPPLFYFDRISSAPVFDMDASPSPPRLLDRVIVLEQRGASPEAPARDGETSGPDGPSPGASDQPPIQTAAASPSDIR